MARSQKRAFVFYKPFVLVILCVNPDSFDDPFDASLRAAKRTSPVTKQTPDPSMLKMMAVLINSVIAESNFPIVDLI